MLYKKRMIKLPEKLSFFLIGVRGSGKTALLKQLFPQALYLDLLDEALYQKYLSNIASFYQQVNTFKSNGTVIVDEIQKLPRLLNEVHRLIESSSRRFILTGSSVRKLKQPGVNLLAGRAGMVTLHPFTPEELADDFNLDQALQYGLIPVIWSSVEKEHALKGYTHTYLKEEIKAEALVKNLPGFTRFLEIAALYHGQAVNMSAIARDCQISRISVRAFFSILEDTNLGFFLPAYASRLKLREKKHSKFYLIDPGLVRSLKNKSGKVSIDEKGFLFEGLVAQILRAYKDYHNLFDSMSYWSPAESRKTEVDFILKKGKDIIAIEVKAKTDVFSQDYKGLRAVKELSNVKKRIIIYLGEEERKTEDGIEIQPFSFFCSALQKGKLYHSE